MFDTIAALFLAHVLADFVLQTRAMVARKHRIPILLLHSALVWLTCALTTGAPLHPALAILTASHLVLDAIKAYVPRLSSCPDGIGLYLCDQLGHLAALSVCAALVPDLFEAGCWGASASWLPNLYLIAAGAIYVTRAGGFAVGKLMIPFAQGAPRDSLPEGGNMIGQLERGLIFLMFLIGQPAGIGFLIAAKSILRFESGSKNDTAEYVIIGTLASFGWAIAVSLGILVIHNGMIDAPLLEIMGTSD